MNNINKLEIVRSLLDYRRTAKTLEQHLHEKYYIHVDEKIRHFLDGGRSLMGIVTFEASKYRKPDIETALKAELAARLATVMKDIIDKDVRRGFQVPYISLEEKDIWRNVYNLLNLGIFDESDIKMAMEAYNIIKKEVELRTSGKKPNLKTYLDIINVKNGNFVAHFVRKVSNERIADGARCLANTWQIVDDFNDSTCNLDCRRYTLPSMNKKLSRSIAFDYINKAKEAFYDLPFLYSISEASKLLVTLPFIEKTTYLLTNPKAFALLISKNYN